MQAALTCSLLDHVFCHVIVKELPVFQVLQKVFDAGHNLTETSMPVPFAPSLRPHGLQVKRFENMLNLREQPPVVRSQDVFLRQASFNIRVDEESPNVSLLQERSRNHKIS